jgi:hypothetical protein
MSTSSRLHETIPRLFQFRLATLLLLTAWIAIVCAALKMPIAPWPSIIGAVSGLSMLVAATVIVYRTGRIRAIAAGYLIFSLGFALQTHSRSPETSYLLATSQDQVSIPMFLFYVMHGEPPVFTPSGPTWPQQSAMELFNFYTIYHHALATILGLLGSLLAQYLYATQPSQQPTDTSKQI